MSIPFTSTSPLRVMCLGDSITAMFPTQNCREPLGTSLRSVGCNVDFVGAFPDTLLTMASCYSAIWGIPAMIVNPSYISSWMQQSTPDVVLMLLGINDIQIYAQAPDATIANLSSIIGKIRAVNPSVHIFLGKYPPLRPDLPDFAVLNNLIPGLAASLSTATSPIVLVDHGPNYNIAIGADTIDGIHPSASGLVKYANNWFNALVSQGLAAAAPVLSDVALNKPVNALPSTDQPIDIGSLSYIVNGGINYGLYWQRVATADQTFEIDLQGSYIISYFELNHFGSSLLPSVDVSSPLNTLAYQIQLSSDNNSWSTVANMTNNSLGRTAHIITPMVASYVRLIFKAPFYLNLIGLREFRVMAVPA